MQYFKKQTKRTRRQLNKKINNKARAHNKSTSAKSAHTCTNYINPKNIGRVGGDAIVLSIVRKISFGMQIISLPDRRCYNMER